MLHFTSLDLRTNQSKFTAFVVMTVGNVNCKSRFLGFPGTVKGKKRIGMSMIYPAMGTYSRLGQ